MTPAEMNAQWDRENQERFESGLRQMLETVEGRAVIYELTVRAGVGYSAPYADSARRTAFLCGRQDLALEVLGEVDKVDPLAWPAILKEAAETKKLRDQLIAEATEEMKDD